MTTTEITIETLETLATEMEHDLTLQRVRLVRLCTAFARIIALRAPNEFARRATHYGDESGSWDSSYPPKKVYSAHTGPLSILVTESATEDTATSSGFYYSWRRTTTRGAIAIGVDGRWYLSDESGTGRLGQFAAHPGDCDVDVTIEWSRVDAGAVTLDELVAAEDTLRVLAFPLVAERMARLGATA